MCNCLKYNYLTPIKVKDARPVIRGNTSGRRSPLIFMGLLPMARTCETFPLL